MHLEIGKKGQSWVIYIEGKDRGNISSIIYFVSQTQYHM